MIANYEKLPFGKYLEILEISKEEGKEEVDKQAAIIGVLNDMDADEVLRLPILAYKKLALLSNFLYEPIRGVKTKKIAKVYNLGKWKLEPVADIRKVTASQYIDFQTFCKDDKKAVEVLSCFLVPQGCKYAEGYDIIELQGAIRDCLPVTEVASLTAFFLSKYQESIKDTLIYSRRMARKLTGTKKAEIMREIAEQLTLLQSVGVG